MENSVKDERYCRPVQIAGVPGEPGPCDGQASTLTLRGASEEVVAVLETYMRAWGSSEPVDGDAEWNELAYDAPNAARIVWRRLLPMLRLRGFRD